MSMIKLIVTLFCFIARANLSNREQQTDGDLTETNDSDAHLTYGEDTKGQLPHSEHTDVVAHVLAISAHSLLMDALLERVSGTSSSSSERTLYGLSYPTTSVINA